MFASFRAIWHSLSLSKQFAIVAVAVLLPGMAVTGWWIAEKIGDAVVRNTASAIAISMDGLLAPYVPELSRGEQISTESQQRLDMLLERARENKTIISMKIWHINGTVMYSTFPTLVGQKFPPSKIFQAALAGEVGADFDDEPHDEDVNERLQGVPLLEIYAPLRDPVTRKIVAVSEFYANGAQLGRDVRSAVTESWLFVCAVAGLMIAFLSGIAVKGGQTIARQQELLRQQVNELTDLLQLNEGLREKLRVANENVSSVNEQVLQHVGADLHDGPAQRLSYAVMRLSDLRRRTRSVEAAKPAIDGLKDILTETLADIRRLSGGLALPELENCTMAEAAALAVKSHEDYTGTTVQQSFTSGEFAGSLAQRNCIYRLVQEGLNNAYKHARARSQRVSLEKSANAVLLRIGDQGPGISNATSASVKGLGLRGMRARVDALGGKLTISEADGGGTAIEAILPAIDGQHGDG